MRIDPFEALGEYLALQLGVSAPVALVLRNRAFRQLMEAAPGWRELITLGKVWHLEQMQASPGRARWDLIVVDAPATGHGVTFLSAPRVVVSALRTGPLRRHAAQVEALVEDPVRTALLPVALAEELPVRETEQLVAQRRERGRHPRRPRGRERRACRGPSRPGSTTSTSACVACRSDAPLGALPAPRVLAACAAHLRARWELHEHWAHALAESIGLPCVRLPYLADGVEGPASLAVLGAALLARRAGGGGVSAADFAQASLLRPRIAICVGSGGVGKTTRRRGARARGGAPRAPRAGAHDRPGAAAGATRWASPRSATNPRRFRETRWQRSASRRREASPR